MTESYECYHIQFAANVYPRVFTPCDQPYLHNRVHLNWFTHMVKIYVNHDWNVKSNQCRKLSDWRTSPTVMIIRHLWMEGDAEWIGKNPFRCFPWLHFSHVKQFHLRIHVFFFLIISRFINLSIYKCIIYHIYCPIYQATEMPVFGWCVTISKLFVWNCGHSSVVITRHLICEDNLAKIRERKWVT